MIGRLENKSERHFKGVLHLLGCQLQLKTRTHEADDRRHAKAAQQHMVGQISDDRDEARIKSDLFARLAQRCGARALAGFEPSAGKRDLSRVALELDRALREEHRQFGRALNERHENCRGNERRRKQQLERMCLRTRQAGQQPLLGLVAWRAPREALGDASLPVGHWAQSAQPPGLPPPLTPPRVSSRGSRSLASSCADRFVSSCATSRIGRPSA